MIRRNGWLAVLLGVAALPVFAADGATSVTLERTPCFGKCPVYRLIIGPDGAVKYVGEYAVATVGERQAQLDDEKLAALASALQSAKFFGMRSRVPGKPGCIRYATDHPSVTIEARAGKQANKVTFYTGCAEAKRDETFLKLADRIDAIVDTEQWTQAAPDVPPGVELPAPLARAISDFEARIDAALAARDSKALEPLIATPFSWVHGSDGRVDTREVWIANAARGMALTGQRVKRTEFGAYATAYGTPEPDTVVRVARVQLLDVANDRESWMRQVRTYVRHGDVWQLALGQGTLMYEGKVLDAALHARYAGTYELADGRRLVLQWSAGGLMATMPNGAKTQLFLESPTGTSERTSGAGSLRFELAADGTPTTASLVRGSQEVWRAPRRAPTKDHP